jgi:hypothetical protein
VPKHVWSYPLLAQRCAGSRRRFSVLCDQILNAVVAQLPTASGREDDFSLVLPLFAEPSFQSANRRSGERGTALLSPLAFAADVGAALQENVTLPESDQLRKTETGLNGE